MRKPFVSDVQGEERDFENVNDAAQDARSRAQALANEKGETVHYLVHVMTLRLAGVAEPCSELFSDGRDD